MSIIAIIVLAVLFFPKLLQSIGKLCLTGIGLLALTWLVCLLYCAIV